jgi:hypothetical protein
VGGIWLFVESRYCGVDGLHGLNHSPMIFLQRLDERRHVRSDSEKRWKDTGILSVVVMVKDGSVEVPVFTDDWLKFRGTNFSDASTKRFVASRNVLWTTW